MSKLNITYDTESKMLDVTVDGKNLENISNISVYKEYNEKEYYCNIYTNTEMNDVKVSTVYYVGASLDDINQRRKPDDVVSIAGFNGYKKEVVNTQSLVKMFEKYLPFKE